MLCDANAESAVVAEFKAAVLAWTAALLERAAASPGAPDWKGLLGAAERATDVWFAIVCVLMTSKGLGSTREIQRRFNVSVSRARVPEKASTLRDRSKR